MKRVALTASLALALLGGSFALPAGEAVAAAPEGNIPKSAPCLAPAVSVRTYRVGYAIDITISAFGQGLGDRIPPDIRVSPATQLVSQVRRGTGELAVWITKLRTGVVQKRGVYAITVTVIRGNCKKTVARRVRVL